MKILIVRLSSMGDVVLASSVVEYLAAQHPSATLGLLTSSSYAELFEYDPRLARVFPYDRGGSEEATAPSDTGGPWDWVVDLQCNRHSSRLIRRLGKAPSVTHVDKLHLLRYALLLLRLDLYDHRRNVVARYLEAAGAAPGKLVAPRIHLAPQWLKMAERAIPPSESRHSLLALAPFSAWRNKQWPAEYFVNVGEHFISRGWRVVILGGPAEASEAAQLGQQLGEHCVNLAGETSVAGSAGVLARSDLVLANDTGLLHLARALGRKAGVVYGATTRHFGFFPFEDPPYRVFETSLRCRPCHAHGGNLCVRGTRPCLRRITPREVIAGLEELHRTPRG